LNRVFDYFKEHDVEHKRNLKISEISSIKIGGAAAAVAYPGDERELIRLLDFLTSINFPYKVIGKMTNILASDEGYPGVLISTQFLSMLEAAGEVVLAGSGLSVNSLLLSSAKMNLGGLEELYGIPGTLGGLLHNNGGRGNFDLSCALLYARVYSPALKKILTLDGFDLRLGYRSSAFFENDYIALSLALAFVKREEPLVLRKIRAYQRERRTCQPLSYPSLGSIFKREGAVAVSRLIDECGLKGRRVGGAEVSRKHAGFIINLGGARASDVLSLIALIKEEIYQNYGFLPKEEIEILN